MNTPENFQIEQFAKVCWHLKNLKVEIFLSFQLIQLEHRQSLEMEEFLKKLQKEQDDLVASCSRELEMDVQRQAKEKERWQKTAKLFEARKRKYILQMQEAEMKQLLQQQKKEYQQNKEDLRKVGKNSFFVSVARSSIIKSKHKRSSSRVEIQNIRDLSC